MEDLDVQRPEPGFGPIVDVEQYLLQGCMRCKFGGTPDCKVHRWTAELRLLRQIVLSTELTEEVKWGVPCYTLDGKNILIVSALKDYAMLSFFNGMLLADPEGLLEQPGPNSQADKLFRFTAEDQIRAREPYILACIQEAIALEKAGKRVEFRRTAEPMPQELIDCLAQDPELKLAFEGLTPGRQRGYILHFSAAKQSATRAARIEKQRGRILLGLGMHDR